MLNEILQDEKYPKNPNEDIQMEKNNNLLNNISILTHLIKITKDLKLNFNSKEKSVMLAD